MSESGTPKSGRLRRALAVGLLALVVLAAGLGGTGFWFFTRSLERHERAPLDRADAIVALTGGSQRIEDAIDLLARGFGRRLLISGVNERTGRDEIVRLAGGNRALVDCCVDLDHRARNTVGNAAETRRWTRENGFASLIVVTSNYHMPRTIAELDHAMPDIRKIPYVVVTRTLDEHPWWLSPGTVRLLLSEYAKFLVVRLRNRMAGGRAPNGMAGQPRVSEASR